MTKSHGSAIFRVPNYIIAYSVMDFFIDFSIIKVGKVGIRNIKI